MKTYKKCLLSLFFTACLISISANAELIRSVDDLSEQTQSVVKTETSANSSMVDLEQTVPATVPMTVKDESPAEASTADESLVKKAVQNKVPIKLPMGKNKILQKFIISMICVIGSSGLLFLILSGIKRFKNKNSVLVNDYSKVLETPQNIKDSISIFLDKNKM